MEYHQGTTEYLEEPIRSHWPVEKELHVLLLTEVFNYILQNTSANLKLN